jgi:hypothetical protein
MNNPVLLSVSEISIVLEWYRLALETGKPVPGPTLAALLGKHGDLDVKKP